MLTLLVGMLCIVMGLVYLWVDDTTGDREPTLLRAMGVVSILVGLVNLGVFLYV